jgi:hypothetical protein
MSRVDEQVLAVVQRYTDEQKSLSDEGIKMELPSVEMKDIEESLQRLQDQKLVIGLPLNAYVPYFTKD